MSVAVSLTGARLIAGVDEVGRGPLAGPVVAAAVILPRPLEGLADSKTLCAEERERLAGLVRAQARIGIGAASVAEIDRINILQASLLAMRRAVLRLGCLPDLALIDGKHAPELPCPVETIVDGDALVPAISAASIVAKVTRDRLMRRLAARYPATAGRPTSATPPAPIARRSGSSARAATTGAASPQGSRRGDGGPPLFSIREGGPTIGRSAPSDAMRSQPVSWPPGAATHHALAWRIEADLWDGEKLTTPRSSRTTRAAWARSAARRRAGGADRSSAAA